MSSQADADCLLITDHKANFDAIYTAPDPRGYYTTLGALGYRLPCRATPVFRTLLRESGLDARRHTILDLCCSYGINAAHLYAPGGPESVTSRYTDPATAALTPDELAASDAAYFAPGRPANTRLVGLDSSAPAIEYALRSRLLTDGWCADLESDRATAALAAGVRDVDVIVSTGGFGYVGRRTFEQLLRHIARPDRLWLVIFVLRVFDYTPIVDLLHGYELSTTKLPTSFPQRRFADAAEQAAAVADVRRQGLDPVGMEEDGWFYADCFVSHPRGAAGTMTDTLRVR